MAPAESFSSCAVFIATDKAAGWVAARGVAGHSVYSSCSEMCQTFRLRGVFNLAKTFRFIRPNFHKRVTSLAKHIANWPKIALADKTIIKIVLDLRFL